MKIFGKELVFTTHLFEMIITLGSTIVGSVIGAMNIPNDVPISLPQYMAMVGLLGFMFGFFISNLLVWFYKELMKN